MVIPFLPSAGWMRRYLAEIMRGSVRPDAAQRASHACALAGKDLNRALLAASGGNSATRVLSVPLEGGGHALKRRGANPRLSEHGKWRREHLGAFLAAYGRSPFYLHLLPEIEAVYAASEGLTIGEFNDSLLNVALRWIDLSLIGPTENALLDRVAVDYRPLVDDRLSIFDAIFRLGRYTGFALRMLPGSADFQDGKDF